MEVITVHFIFHGYL